MTFLQDIQGRFSSSIARFMRILYFPVLSAGVYAVRSLQQGRREASFALATHSTGI